MDELISQRLVKLRKHLGERLGRDIAQAELAEMAGIKSYYYQRFETGLKGAVIHLVTLLNFYREQGYNLDWILAPDNTRIPMVTADGNKLIEIGQEMMQMSKLLEKSYSKLNGQLRTLGYQPDLIEEKTQLPEPVGIGF